MSTNETQLPRQEQPELCCSCASGRRNTAPQARPFLTMTTTRTRRARVVACFVTSSPSIAVSKGPESPENGGKPHEMTGRPCLCSITPKALTDRQSCFSRGTRITEATVPTRHLTTSFQPGKTDGHFPPSTHTAQKPELSFGNGHLLRVKQARAVAAPFHSERRQPKSAKAWRDISSSSGDADSGINRSIFSRTCLLLQLGILWWKNLVARQTRYI